MVTVTFPFSVLNNIPGVSGVDDLVIDIPDIDEIREEIEDVLQDADTATAKADVLGQLRDQPGLAGQTFNQVLGNALFIGGQPAPLLEDIAAVINGDDVDDGGGGGGGGQPLPNFEELLEDAVEEIRQSIRDNSPTIGAELEETEDTIIDAITDTAVDADQIVTDITNNLRGDLDDLAPDVNNLAEAVAREVQVTGDGGVSIQIDGFFGPVGRDIVEGFGGVLQALLNDDEGGIPDESDITDIFDDRLSSFFGDLPGGDILTDPDAFIEDLVDALTDALVSEEASEELQDALDNN